MEFTAKDEAIRLVNTFKPLLRNTSESFIERSLKLDEDKKEAIKIVKEKIDKANNIVEYDYWVKVKKEIEML